MADSAEKRKLIAQIDRARSQATAHQRELVEDLKIRDKVHELGDELKGDFKESVDQHRGVWLGAAALVGLVIAKLPTRTKVLISENGKTKAAKEAKQAGKLGLVVAALGWLFKLVRPMLISWGTKRLTQAFTNPSRGYGRT